MSLNFEFWQSVKITGDSTGQSFLCGVAHFEAASQSTEQDTRPLLKNRSIRPLNTDFILLYTRLLLQETFLWC